MAENILVPEMSARWLWGKQRLPQMPLLQRSFLQCPLDGSMKESFLQCPLDGLLDAGRLRHRAQSASHIPHQLLEMSARWLYKRKLPQMAAVWPP
jgi:hypothetical protein